jgi:hypothetical protein
MILWLSFSSSSLGAEPNYPMPKSNPSNFLWGSHAALWLRTGSELEDSVMQMLSKITGMK